MLHMKTGSVLALRPGFFTSAPEGSYSGDLSERDRSARMLVSPESVYGTAWSTAATVVDHVAVVVREPADWLPPGGNGDAVRALESEGAAGLVHHHEVFFNGSLHPDGLGLRAILHQLVLVAGQRAFPGPWRRRAASSSMSAGWLDSPTISMARLFGSSVTFCDLARVQRCVTSVR